MLRVDISLVGNTARVLLSRPEQPDIRVLGGAGFSAAVGMLAVGARPRLISVIGDDLAPDERNWVSRVAGKPQLRIEPGPTCVFRFTGDPVSPGIECSYGSSAAITDHAVCFSYANCWLHICCRNPLDVPRLLRHAISQQPLGISVDFISSSLGQQMADVAPHLSLIDYVFLNKAEYARVSEQLKERFSGVLILTKGSAGAEAIQRGRRLARAVAPRTRSIDTVGAGDVLAGAFLARRLSHAPIDASLQAAVSLASKKIEQFGVTSLLTLEGPAYEV